MKSQCLQKHKDLHKILNQINVDLITNNQNKQKEGKRRNVSNVATSLNYVSLQLQAGLILYVILKPV